MRRGLDHENIKSASYDEAARRMTLEFVDGDHEFYGVPPELYAAILLVCDVRGEYFRDYMRKQYSGRKV